jgi:hypothetical protein
VSQTETKVTLVGGSPSKSESLAPAPPAPAPAQQTNDLIISALIEAVINMAKTIDQQHNTQFASFSYLVSQLNGNYKKMNRPTLKCDLPAPMAKAHQQH